MTLRDIAWLNDITFIITAKCEVHLYFVTVSESNICCSPFCQLLKNSYWGKPATCWSRLVTSFYISNRHFSQQPRNVVKFEARLHTDVSDFLGCHKLLKLELSNSFRSYKPFTFILSLDDHYKSMAVYFWVRYSPRSIRFLPVCAKTPSVGERSPRAAKLPAELYSFAPFFWALLLVICCVLFWGPSLWLPWARPWGQPYLKPSQNLSLLNCEIGLIILLPVVFGIKLSDAWKALSFTLVTGLVSVYYPHPSYLEDSPTCNNRTCTSFESFFPLLYFEDLLYWQTDFAVLGTRNVMHHH